MKDLAKIYKTFWSQFDVPAFARDNVPSNTEFPYITYTVIRPDTLQTSTQQVFVWTKPPNKSLEQLYDICDRISNVILPGGIKVYADNNNGLVTFYRGAPFIQNYQQEEDTIKAAYINVDVVSYQYV